MKKTLALRFDVDSVRCAEEGIPNLMRLADRVGVRFTFFVNMGYSFNWRHNLSHVLRKRSARRGPMPRASRRSLATTEKLGATGVLKTIFLNPRLGDRYRVVFDALHGEGHELGLHGGMDHVIWQRSLGTLTPAGLESLFEPAYSTFKDRYGPPGGFASPGFVYNDSVLAMLDRYGFLYASDMPGEEPFRPRGADGATWTHYQVPVNISAAGNVPVIEEGLAIGLSEGEIVDRCVEEIAGRSFALMYGHPYVEGVHPTILEQMIRVLNTEYDVVPVVEYLNRWKEERGA